MKTKLIVMKWLPTWILIVGVVIDYFLTGRLWLGVLVILAIAVTAVDK